MCQWLPGWHSPGAPPQLSAGVTPFPLRHVCSVPARETQISRSSSPTRERAGAQGCLHATERSASYSIFPFHLISFNISHVPARSIIRERRCAQLPTRGQPTSETPHRAQECAPEPEEGRQAWKPVWLGTQSSASCTPVPSPAAALSPCSGWPSWRRMGAGRWGTLSDTAITSLGLQGGGGGRGSPLPLQGLPGDAQAPSLQRARPGSPRLTCSLALWFLAHESVKKPKASPRLPGEPRRRRQSSPHPHGAPWPATAPQSSRRPRRQHSPTNTPGSRDASPSTKTQR